jgi:hypothetical protein
MQKQGPRMQKEGPLKNRKRRRRRTEGPRMQKEGPIKHRKRPHSSCVVFKN